MFSLIFRLFWRALIFALGIVLAWLAITKVYPYADSQLPAFLVIFIFYCVFAYGIIPLLIRLFRIVIKPDHIPLYVTAGDGWPSDPVNIALIVTNRAHLIKKMKQAGWYTADPPTIRNLFREAVSIIFNTSYPAAPISNLYLFNRPHDIGFEIPTNGKASARTRHHVRFWRLEEPVVSMHHKHHLAYRFWFQKLEHLFAGSKEMWIGAATEDIHPHGIRWPTGQITHGVSHESDKERDFIIESLQGAKVVSDIHDSEPGEQLRFRGQQIRTYYVSNGGIKILRLK
jgi:LssY-like putative type I secretion system component LssY